ncbi:response regulator [Thalassomonas haliotis]|uniref:Response regulator n=1 Tax=Thalassomonas haliotis TaxID=485448 RepID=A0ABY7VA78_9GAMM|nr:response regulator [Thalassomonas haliotis]WDE10221.1 response regulator [Thalassomonas haliotis]
MNDSLSSGQIAKLCGVHLRTVIRWIEQGYLKGYKLPGRGNNRVLKQDFIAFLKESNMPIPRELAREEKCVLVVDDDPLMAQAISLVLRANGWQTLMAENGFEAGFKVSKFPVDLITLDLVMPTLDGFDVLKILKQDENLQHIPVIVISASPEQDLAKAKELGASEVLTKPFDNNRLIAVAKKLMGH